MAIIFSSALVGLNELDFNGLFAVKAEAASVDDLTFTLNDDGKSYSVTDCDTAAEGELVIPGTYNGLPVTNIDSSAFVDCEILTSITIPYSVTNIEASFGECSNLTSINVDENNPNYSSAGGVLFNKNKTILIRYPVNKINVENTIPNSVMIIESYAFSGCTKLDSITIPDSVLNIEDDVFNGCTSLTSINVDCNNPSYSSIDGILFNKDETILFRYPAGKTNTEYTIPDDVIGIGKSAFSGCKNLTSIAIPRSVMSADSRAFSGCENLSSVYITDIDSWCAINFEPLLGQFCTSNPLYYAEKLYLSGKLVTDLVLPNSVININNYAFRGYKGLTSIVIPGSAISVGRYAFRECTNLTSVEIQDGVTDIKYSAFSKCVNLCSITIPQSVKNIEGSAFFDCTNLTTVYYSGTQEQWESLYIGIDNEPLLSANIVCIGSGDIEDDELEPPEFPEEPITGSFTVAHKEKQHTYTYEYKDSYFDKPATEYNHDLATMSLCLALSTFQSEDIELEDGKKLTYQNASKLLKECGFTNGRAYNYISTTSPDNIGCLIYQKKIGDETLIAVAIRSGGYYKEWASNAKLGEVGDHQGFDEASDCVLAYINNYIKDKKISGNIKLWITGYSRGAATATQTAAKLNFEFIDGVDFTKEQIYAYGFATPAGAIEDSDPTNLDKYGNIFNIINFHDIVPKVAPQEWGFWRYGRTLFLPFNENSDNAVNYEKQVKYWFELQGLEYKIDGLFDVSSKNGKELIETSLGCLEIGLVSLLVDKIGQRNDYVDNWQVLLQQFLIALMGEKGEYNSTSNKDRKIYTKISSSGILNEYKEIKNLLESCSISYVELLPLLSEPHGAFGAYYLGWMQTIPSENALEYFNDGSYRRWLINCPVDVYVCDTSGNLVAAIENDMPVEIEGSIFSYGVDENGQKYFYLPVDAEYNITLKAREKCETTCTVNEFSGGSLTESRVVTFSEIDIEKGKELSVSTGAYSEEDITEGTENGSSAEYVIQDENEQIIEPDVDVAGEEIEDFTYNVTVEYDENKGIVYGGGTFTIGQFCQVTAENKPGYRFSKWTVTGETVSTDSTYRFAVKEDVTIVAEYVPCEHPNYINEVVAPTCTEEGYTKHTCEVCTYSYNDTTVNANGHTLSDWITDKKATVYSAGSKHKECTVCDEIVETAQIPQIKCSKPSIKSASNDGKNVKVTWKKVSGADTYYVYRKVKGGSYSYLGKTTKTYYVDKTAKAGKTYTYKLRAKNEAGYSSYSSTKTVKHLDQPTLKTATNTTSGVKISWGKVSSISGYKVYRKTSDGWKYLGKTTKTYFTDKTAKSGKKYTYTVKAYNGDYSSSYSSTGVSRYYLAYPTLKTPNSTKKGVKLEWSKVTGAEGYMVYRKTGSGSYSRIATVKGSSKVTYTDKSAKKGKTYTYKVKAYKSKTYSAYSNTPKIKDKY